MESEKQCALCGSDGHETPPDWIKGDSAKGVGATAGHYIAAQASCLRAVVAEVKALRGNPNGAWFSAAEWQRIQELLKVRP